MAAIRTGLKNNLTAAFTDAQCNGYLLSTPTAPGFEIELDPEGVNYDQAFRRGLDEWWLIVRAYVQTGSDIGAQKDLDTYLEPTGANSVKTAIESDRTLGITGVDCSVSSVTGYRIYQSVSSPGSTFLGAEWRVRVIAQNP